MKRYETEDRKCVFQKTENGHIKRQWICSVEGDTWTIQCWKFAKMADYEWANTTMKENMKTMDASTQTDSKRRQPNRWMYTVGSEAEFRYWKLIKTQTAQTGVEKLKHWRRTHVSRRIEKGSIYRQRLWRGDKGRMKYWKTQTWKKWGYELSNGWQHVNRAKENQYV